MTSKKQDKGPSKRKPGSAPRTPPKSDIGNPISGKRSPGAASKSTPAPGAASREAKTTRAPGLERHEHHQLQPLPAFTVSPGLLTPLQHRFTQEYLADGEMNGTQAYQRARPEATYDTCKSEASRLLANPNIQRQIQRLMDERARRTGITADRVLLRLWDIATADARRLTEIRIGSCRHCWGLYNQYQYTDAEFSAAQDKHIREEAKRSKAEGGDFQAKAFPEKGGCGYDPSKPPNPECPECWGDGSTRPIIHDTRSLGPGEAALFAGIKVSTSATGKQTINLHMEDRATYLQMVGRHLGMWNDKISVTDTENPLMALIQQIQQAHSTVPIVQDDPERRTPRPVGQVQDVEAKHAAPGAASPMGKPKKWRAV